MKLNSYLLNSINSKDKQTTTYMPVFYTAKNIMQTRAYHWT